MKSWVPVRLTAKTYMRLLAMRQALAAVGEGSEQYDPADPGVFLSVDALVSRLLDARDRHARRRKESATRRKKPRRSADAGTFPPGASAPDREGTTPAHDCSA